MVDGARADAVHEVARNFSNAGTSDSSKEGPQLSPHSPIHLALPLAWDCKENKNHKVVNLLFSFLIKIKKIYFNS